MTILNFIEDVGENTIVHKLYTTQTLNKYNRYTFKGAVFAERFNRTIRDLLIEAFFF